ncbi:MAG: branched-chain amino acid ABC transporter permease [Archaeoglobaceae archaeon]
MVSINREILLHLATPLAILIISAILPPSLQRVMIMLIIYLALAICWLTIFKMGYVSLGSAAFYGLGMYLFVYLSILGLPKILDFIIIAIFIFFFSLTLGYITLRLTGIFFILATFATAEALRQIFIFIEINYTGYIGKIIRDSLSIFETLSLLSLLLLLASIFYFILSRDRIKVILNFIREDEVLARISGINTLKYKLIIFSTSSVIQGLLGSVAAWYLAYIDPEIAFNPTISIQTLAIGLMGGTGHYLGPFASALILILLSEQLIRIAPNLHLIVIGGIVIIFSRVGMGFSELIEILWRWLKWGK